MPIAQLSSSLARSASPESSARWPSRTFASNTAASMSVGFGGEQVSAADRLQRRAAAVTPQRLQGLTETVDGHLQPLVRPRTFAAPQSIDQCVDRDRAIAVTHQKREQAELAWSLQNQPLLPGPRFNWPQDPNGSSVAHPTKTVPFLNWATDGRRGVQVSVRTPRSCRTSSRNARSESCDVPSCFRPSAARVSRVCRVAVAAVGGPVVGWGRCCRSVCQARPRSRRRLVGARP